MNMHKIFMEKALELAKKAWGKTNPEPLVGGVLVKSDQIILQGYYNGCKNNFAKDNIINTSSAQDSTLYINIEHFIINTIDLYGIESIIKKGIKKVYIAMLNPDPKVKGKHVQKLREAGIEVEVGLLEKKAQKLNEIYSTYVTKKKPFVLLKCAMTLDGKIAAYTGHSKWVSCEASREMVHEIRDRMAAIMVGINTVLKDNPTLTTRRKEITDVSHPIRLIIDSSGKTPIDCRLIQTCSEIPVIIATTSNISSEKKAEFLRHGITVLVLDGENNRVNLKALMDELYKLHIDSILLEGGGELIFSAIKENIVDKVMFFIAPKFIGGRSALSPMEGDGFPTMDMAKKIKDIEVSMVNEDVLIEGYL